MVNDPIKGLKIYDTNDLVVPPVESDAMFITTGFIMTIQQQGQCNSAIACTSVGDCIPTLTSTGQILADCNTTEGFCQMFGWCPLALDTTAAIVQIQDVENVTVFMRSSVKYESFNVYANDPSDPLLGVNLFTLSDIISPRNISDCSTSGCIVAVQIDWTCNLNQGSCGPLISFLPITGGFNFRDTNYDIGQDTRELEKLYGVRLLMKITGTGGRFSFFQAVITIGSGAAFLTLATVITDLTLIYCCGGESVNKKKWNHLKFNTSKNNEEEDPEGTEHF